jgi:uncharacterized protein YbjT (DUF2867 family)
VGGDARRLQRGGRGVPVEVALPADCWHWLAIEVVVERSGLSWAHIVPSAVMAATLTGSYPLAGERWVSRIAGRQPLRVPFAHAGVPLIHEADLAEAAAQILLGDRFDGRRVEVAGRPVSAVERVRALRAATGLPITLDEVDAARAPEVLASMGLADHDIEHLLGTLSWFDAHKDESYRATESLLGRPLRDFGTWARENAAAFS